jgi:hypothetical protein
MSAAGNIPSTSPQRSHLLSDVPVTHKLAFEYSERITEKHDLQIRAINFNRAALGDTIAKAAQKQALSASVQHGNSLNMLAPGNEKPLVLQVSPTKQVVFESMGWAICTGRDTTLARHTAERGDVESMMWH